MIRIVDFQEILSYMGFIPDTVFVGNKFTNPDGPNTQVWVNFAPEKESHCYNVSGDYVDFKDFYEWLINEDKNEAALEAAGEDR